MAHGEIQTTAVTSSYATLAEILSQEQAWRGILATLHTQEGALRAQWEASGQSEVIFTACGSPFYIGRSAAAILQGATGVRTAALPSSDLAFFPELALASVAQSGPPLLAVASRSGETSEVLRAVETFRTHGGGPVVAVTCYENTALERLASLTLVAREAQEESLAQTRSFTSMLIAMQGLAFAIGGRPFTPAFLALPDHVTGLIERGHALAQQLGDDLAIERFFFLGSGPLYGLACEAMLKMKEMSLSYSEAYHVLEFRHGPMAMVDERSLVVGLLSERALPHEVTVLHEMQQRGATVLAITPAQLADGLVTHQVVLPSGFSDWERAPLYLPIPQLISYYRAVRKGLNPDRPQNLSAFVQLDIAAIAGRTLTTS